MERVTPVDIRRRVRRELPQLTDSEVGDLARTIERLVACFAPQRVYVFGSHVRAAATRDSDVDLMVIVRDSDEPAYRRAQRAFRAVGDHSVALDIVVWTSREFDARLPAAASLPATIAREGRLLFAA